MKRERERERVQREIIIFYFFFSSLISQIYGNRTVGFCQSKRNSLPHIESYAWAPKSWSFVKLHEVGNFPTCIISSLKAI